MNDETAWIDVHGTVAETDRAVLLKTDAGEIWIPKSMMKARRKDTDGNLERLELPRWLAKSKGLVNSKDEP